VRSIVFVTAVSLAGCGGAGEARKECRDATEPVPRFPHRISVDEAVDAADGWRTVEGSIMRTAAGEVFLCSALAESHPPQCAGSSLRVEGLRDLAAFEHVEQALGIEWSSGAHVGGYLDDGVLRVLLSCRAEKIADDFEAKTGLRLTLNTFASNADADVLDVASHPSRVPSSVRSHYGVFFVVVSGEGRDPLGSFDAALGRDRMWLRESGQWLAARRYADDVALLWIAGTERRTDDRWRRVDGVLTSIV
jgi:hypothetical protein